MKEKRKLSTRKIIILVCVSVVVLGVLLWALFVGSVRCTLFSKEYGRCLSIALMGKRELRGVDKAVITYQDGTGTITNPEVLNRLVEETRTAAYGGSHGGKDATIELYRGDELVRTMYFSECCNTVTVYETDATHWIFSWWIVDTYEYGYVNISDELANCIMP